MIQLSANSNDTGGGATVFDCNLDPPNFNSNSGLDLDLHPQLGISIITHTISSIPTMTTSTGFSTQTISGSSVNSFESSSSQHGPSYIILHWFFVLPVAALGSKYLFPTSISRPGNHDTSIGSIMSFLTDGDVDEKMHSKVVIVGSRPAGHTAAIHLAQANLDSVLFEDFMGNLNGFAADSQTHRYRQCSANNPLRFGTRIITETISKIDLSYRPFRYWREGQEDEEPKTADTVIVATSASVKEVGIESLRWAVPIFRNTPLAVIGSGVVSLQPKNLLTILWNAVATECQGDDELSKNLRIRNVQTGSEKDLAVNGLFYALSHEPVTAIFPHSTPDQSTRYIVTVPGTDSEFHKAITSAARSGCMAALEVERLIAEEEEKEMVGE
ncbi:hypothetical protein K435DRAFT_963487 [Dendrothele bispora CBS 962.96]|uniref:FAD/NAD(P)-binding domain-containing protein n=1 Tax=Dendrothele bispora (strain CBS 962.96) TaxID=1314807 RepID=A0A4S8MGE4_DENBC|nr:hypothetical protein K435DRAFT_963487 [Dendrothele bispora CBS 962.96]